MLYWVHGSPTGHTFEASQRVNNKDKISISLIYYFGTSPNRTIKTNSKVLNVLKAEKITFIKYKFHPQSRWRQSRYFLGPYKLNRNIHGKLRKGLWIQKPWEPKNFLPVLYFPNIHQVHVDIQNHILHLCSMYLLQKTFLKAKLFKSEAFL